ncbi:hypothetical protein B0H15DRAFT_806218 [Mycena belliarum]|uniref:Uncharacterized protein n=1 Tax=Mycena belliarum TaxID=1033014 RepID=A0AAD6TPC2_9AGAR|nr:hypothetical protein B0H15DRAFT_806218 [Mycena belliae]
MIEGRLAPRAACYFGLPALDIFLHAMLAANTVCSQRLPECYQSATGLTCQCYQRLPEFGRRATRSYRQGDLATSLREILRLLGAISPSGFFLMLAPWSSVPASSIKHPRDDIMWSKPATQSAAKFTAAGPLIKSTHSAVKLLWCKFAAATRRPEARKRKEVAEKGVHAEEVK